MDYNKVFLQYYEEVKENLISYIKEYKLPQHAMDYLENMINYNVSNGKLTRGIATLTTVYELTDNSPSEKQVREACILGWAIEWLQACFLLFDDIMDKSEMRRSKQCWYRREGVGQEAINDGLLLLTQVYIILRKYFSTNPNYLSICELFNTIKIESSIGQLLDSKPCNLDDFNMDYYKQITHLKTAVYTFYFPIAAGYIYMGYISDEILNEIREISYVLGEYFQIQDDYLDCFGDSNITGKVGTDIQDKKCTWLVIKTLEDGNEEDKKVLNEYLGKNGKEDIDIVKNLYNKMKIPEKFNKLEEEMKLKIEKMVNDSKIKSKIVFNNLFKMIYKRKK